MANSKKAQERYRKKCKIFKLTYGASVQDQVDAQRLQKYLDTTGQSASTYLKKLVRQDLDSKEWNMEIGSDGI